MTRTLRIPRLARLGPLFLMLAACLLAAPARAQSAPAGADYQALGLSNDQRAKVQALHKSIGKRMRELGQALRERRTALEGVYGDYNMDEGKARQLNKQINDTQREILEQHYRLQVDLRKILTPDQFTRLQAMIRQHHQGRGKK